MVSNFLVKDNSIKVTLHSTASEEESQYLSCIQQTKGMGLQIGSKLFNQHKLWQWFWSNTCSFDCAVGPLVFTGDTRLLQLFLFVDVWGLGFFTPAKIICKTESFQLNPEALAKHQSSSPGISQVDSHSRSNDKNEQSQLLRASC